MDKKKPTHWKTGLIIGVVLIGTYLLSDYYIHLDKIRFGNWIGEIPFIAGLIINGALFSKINHHNVTFADVFKSCFKVTLIVSIFTTAYYAIDILSSPEIIKEGMDKAMQYGREQHFNEKQMQAMDNARGMIKYTVIFSMFLVVIVRGTLFSLLGALIAKKKRQPANAMI